jgi:hypothetical protein
MKLVSVAWRVQNHVTRQRNAPATGRMLVTGAGMMDAICQHRASGPYEASARWQSVSWKISVGKLCVTGVGARGDRRPHFPRGGASNRTR